MNQEDYDDLMADIAKLQAVFTVAQFRDEVKTRGMRLLKQRYRKALAKATLIGTGIAALVFGGFEAGFRTASALKGLSPKAQFYATIVCTLIWAAGVLGLVYKMEKACWDLGLAKEALKKFAKKFEVTK